MSSNEEVKTAEEVKKPEPLKKKSRLKAVDPQVAEPQKPKILIFGKAGVGKTWMSLEFPNVYYIDTEGGASREQYIEKLKKAGGVYFGPDQGAQSFESVIEELKTLATEEHHYKTVVIDSISKLYNNEIFKEADRLGNKDAFGASKKPATNLTRKLINWIDRIDMNVVIIAHEKPAWEKQEQVGYTFDAWDKLEYELDLAIQVKKVGDKRMGLIRKSRLESFGDGTSFNWSYGDFATGYGRDVIEKQGRAIELASPEQLIRLSQLISVCKIPEGQEDKWFAKAKVTSYQEMDKTQVAGIIQYIEGKIKGESK